MFVTVDAVLGLGQLQAQVSNMGINAAIAIGVARAGTLPELPGAIAGARSFIEWACAAERFHSYECHLITDENAPVTVDRISATISKILQDDIDRLLLFFSGHGLGTAAGDFWLLSHWEDDSDEAVNLSLSFNNAKRWPMGQVAVFADSCRSTSSQMAFVGGRSIFPRSRVTPRVQPQWDHFLATRLGEIAQEVTNSDPTKAYGVFSRCLLDALHGRVPQVLENRPPPVVTSQGLASYLEEAVPLESGKIPGAMVQYPDVVPSWRRPKDFYFGVIEQAFSPGHSSPSPNAGVPLDVAPHVGMGRDEDLGTDFSFVVKDFGDPADAWMQRNREADRARAVVDQNRKTTSEAIDATVARYAASQGRETFETRQGLTIIGERVRDVASGDSADLFVEHGAYHVSGGGAGPQTVALRLGGDSWAAALILPDLVGVLHVEDGLVQSLNYVPARHGRFDLGRHDAYDAQTQSEAELVHRWTAMMNRGLPAEKKKLRRVAEKLREHKHRNPALGIFAAYGFERAGNWRLIDRMVGYFGEACQAVPFDIALLSSRPRLRGRMGVSSFENPALPQIAGTFPLLRHGWAMLDRSDEALSPNLERLRSGVLPALWTTFDDKSGRRFAKLVESGEL